MSNGTSRFSFPGLLTWDTEDTSTHQVERVTIKDGGAVFILTMIRSKAFQDRPFLVASIADDKGEELWTFKKENFHGVGLLAKADEAVVVALCGSGSGAVERVIPLSSLSGSKQHDLRVTIDLKRAAADFLKKKVKLTEIEQKLFDFDEARRREDEEARQAVEAEVRQAARQERIKAIRSRSAIVVYAADGKKLSGIPVTEKEWSSLGNGAYAVIVDDPIGADGKIGDAREWFRVVKEHGRNPQRYGVKPVTTQCPEAAKVSVTKPMRISFIDTAKGAFEVLLFASTDAIRAAAKAGLNTGAYVAVVAQQGDQVEVYTLRDEMMKSAGKHILLA
ncbi:DUF2058 domain-containing protein [Candidatus Kaiserbacteria bacterium]|nr:DUF2058 domain-containing protein [Candidatus Kaiserbacteria bacterium]